MKNIFFILSIFFFFIGCSEEETKQQENSIYGSWRLAKRTANNANGSPNNWENVNNGFILKFEESLRFKSNESTICQNNLNEGMFSISTIENEDNIEISIDNCNSSPNDSFIRVFYYSFNENDLILIPKDPACDEGCAFLYIKNNE